MFHKTIRTYPVTIFITIVSLVVACSTSLSFGLQLDYERVARGQWWRLATGHVTHWGFSHLFWDVCMFAALSAICERRHRRWYAPVTLASLLFISAAIAITCPTITTYRGLSGIDTGLFVWFVVDQVKISLRQGDKLIAWISALAVIALLGKLIFEATTGGTLFVDSTTFIPLVESHLAGAAFGLIAGAIGIASKQGELPIRTRIAESRLAS